VRLFKLCPNLLVLVRQQAVAPTTTATATQARTAEVVPSAHSVVAAVWQLPKLLPHLHCLLAHELDCGDVAVSGGLGKLLVKVLVLKAAVLLQQQQQRAEACQSVP
jgi:hypothetical protein